MENEVMSYEEEIMEPEVEFDEVGTENSGLSTGLAMLIGAGLTIATAAIVKLGKKAYAAYKAKKELRHPDEGDVIEVTDEDLMDVTK